MGAGLTPPLTTTSTGRPHDPYPVFRAADGVAVPVDGWTYPPTSARSAHDLTPPEVALSKVLAAWVEWASAGKPENDDAIGWSLRGIEKSLFIFGLVHGNEPSVSGAALLDRARKAGVL